MADSNRATLSRERNGPTRGDLLNEIGRPTPPNRVLEVSFPKRDEHRGKATIRHSQEQIPAEMIRIEIR